MLLDLGLFAVVPQFASLAPELTVRECLQFAADTQLPSTVTTSAKSTAIDDYLNVLQLSHIEHSRIATISGGQLKRVSIATNALLTTARVIVSNF